MSTVDIQPPSMSATAPINPAPSSPPTDYGALVVDIIPRMTRSGTIDQRKLRQCIGLASSYLVTDSMTNPIGGMASWRTGFNRLVDILVALHARDELELETVSTASKACSECWSVANTWRDMEDCKENIRAIAVRLKGILDENEKTYKGGRVYVP